MKLKMIRLMITVLLLCMGLCACRSRSEKAEESVAAEPTAIEIETTIQTEFAATETEPGEVEIGEESTTAGVYAEGIEATEQENPTTIPSETEPPVTETPEHEFSEVTTPNNQPDEDEFPEIPV